MRKTKPDADRFWEKVEARGPDECWPWGGTLMPNGYGTFRVGSLTDGSRRNVLAHRFMCEETKRPLKDGEWALHHCDNPPCVNPKHLYIGTHADNTRDAVERGLFKSTPAFGETNPNAKLTDAQVRAICASTEKNATLARQYGVSRTHIGWLKTGRARSTAHGHNDLRGVANSSG